MSRRRGFTFVEMLVAMIIFGLLASIAILKYIDLRHQATAARIAKDIDAIRVGAYNHWADHEAFPADAASGIVPAPLETYLPAAFRFDRGDYTYDWDNFGTGAPGYQVGVTVTISDPRLESVVLRTFGGRLPFFRSGNSLTYILVGPDGRI